MENDTLAPKLLEISSSLLPPSHLQSPGTCSCIIIKLWLIIMLYFLHLHHYVFLGWLLLLFGIRCKEDGAGMGQQERLFLRGNGHLFFRSQCGTASLEKILPTLPPQACRRGGCPAHPGTSRMLLLRPSSHSVYSLLASTRLYLPGDLGPRALHLYVTSTYFRIWT